MTNCPNCQAAYKESVFGSVLPTNQRKANLINEYIGVKSLGYCSKCSPPLFDKSKTQLEKEVRQLSSFVEDTIKCIPIITADSPHGWQYEILSIVTGQSVTGTGVLSEFKSAFTDMFGLQSGSYNKKLKGGEDRCFAQLRKAAVDNGGNAVIATDIDYAEVGGGEGMLMVCAAGTAVKVSNTSVFGEREGLLQEFAIKNTRLNYLIELNVE